MKIAARNILFAILAAAPVLIIVFHFYTIFSAYQLIIIPGHEYAETTAYSYDNAYILQTVRIEENSSVYASFVVMDSSTQELLFSCPNKYRTWDLKEIVWDSDTYNIIVKSGDIGTVHWKYENADWFTDYYNTEFSSSVPALSGT